MRQLREDLFNPSDKVTKHWVALQGCCYDRLSRKPANGLVVDTDEDLGDLLARLGEERRRGCVVMFCDDGFEIDMEAEPPTMRRVARATAA